VCHKIGSNSKLISRIQFNYVMDSMVGNGFKLSIGKSLLLFLDIRFKVILRLKCTDEINHWNH